MNKSHSDKHERLGRGRVERRVVSAGAPAARNVLAVFLVLQIVFGLTIGFIFFEDIKVGDAQVSPSVADPDLPEAHIASQRENRVASVAISSDGVVEIGSLAGLLIAAYAYNSGASIADIPDSQIEGAQNIDRTSFRLVNNISGIFTSQDIDELDDAFSSGWGKSAEGNGALENVVKARTGDTLTILNSLFDDFSGAFDGNGYVINTFNLMGGVDDAHKENIGFFATIAKGAVVKNLHLRNVNVVADGATNVGGLAGTALSDVTNVSVHGMFNVSDGTNLGGIIGVLGERGTAPALIKAIALGAIYANGVKFVGGAVGSNPNGGSLQNVVSMIYVYAVNGTMADGIVNGGEDPSVSFYLENSVWLNNKIGTSTKANVSYSTMYFNSVSGYESAERYYLSKAVKSKLYDALDDRTLENMSSDDAPRESMRLCDIIDVYLLKYSLQEERAKIDDGYYSIYKKSEKSWLVGNAKGIDSEPRGPAEADPIIICDQQGVSLLRELRFATFKLTADVYLPASYEFNTWQGAFFGKIYNNKTGENAYVEDGYHIYIKGYEGENIFELTPTNVRTVEFPVKAY